MGFLDDRHNLNPYLRLGVGFLAAGAVVAAGIGISFISNPLGGIIDLSQPQIAFSLFGNSHSIWILIRPFCPLLDHFYDEHAQYGSQRNRRTANRSRGHRGGYHCRPVSEVLGGYYPVAGNYFGLNHGRGFPGIFALAYLSAKNHAGLRRRNFGGIFTGGSFHPFNNQGRRYWSWFWAYPWSIPAILLYDEYWRENHRSGETGGIFTTGFWMPAGANPKWPLFYWAITGLLGIIALNLNTPSKFYTIVGVAVFVLGLIVWLTYRPKSSV